FCRPRPPFFLVSPRPPISTLFPYTTLFRSVGRLVRVQVEGLSGRFETAVRSELEARLDLAFGDLEQERATVVAQRQRAAAPQRPDRKSTRLNSSHVKISYAVFCLKKKKERS